VIIDRCSSCGGAWLEQGELEAIVETRDHSQPESFVQETLSRMKPGLPEGSQNDLLACPSCSMNMKVVNYAYDSGVIINVCPSHGIWLDSKELERIEAYRDHWKSEATKRRTEWSEHIRPGSTDGSTGSGLLHFLKSIF
jgi:Zn-finger nucleic acid-binding protein